MCGKIAGAKIVVDIKDRDTVDAVLVVATSRTICGISPPTIHGKHIDFEEFCVSLTCKITLRDTLTPSAYGAIA